MAIQNRRGPYEKLDKTKLLPGEYAIVLQDDPFCKDGKSVYICFHAGDTKRMATFEDMQENIEDITDEIEKEFASGIMKRVQKKTGIKGKDLWMTTRAVVTGNVHGPDLDSIMVVLGKQEVLDRINKALNR